MGNYSAKTFMFEACWELTKKAGGIYTVLRSKASTMIEEYTDQRYACIGPYFYNPTEFDPGDPSTMPHCSEVVEIMQQKYGVKVYFGRWLVSGSPKVFLLDLESSRDKVGQWKAELLAGIDPPFQYGDVKLVEDALIFGHQAAWLLSEFASLNSDYNVVAQFHEWMVGVPALLLKKWGFNNVATIFTTHATILGRYLCAGRVDLYHDLTRWDSWGATDNEAKARGIHPQFYLERAAAHCAHVFTTVSEITADEAEHLIGRRPEVIVPNGLQIERFVALHEFQNLHKRYKKVIQEFVRGHFYGHYDFDLDNTLFYFTSGRYEYYNKGMDMYIDALARLNDRLKRENSNTTIIAFIITSTNTNGFNVASLEGQSVIRDLRNTIDGVVKDMGEQLFETTLKCQLIKPQELLQPQHIIKLKRRIFTMMERKTLPPIVTHNMVDENDEVLAYIRMRGLLNQKWDRVKVIYHPQFLSSTNPLLPLEYPEFVRGCHLGVFPSYYEPWGYTPAECTVLGIPSISTNLTGFSGYVTKHIPEPEKAGLFIVDRRFKGYDDACNQLTEYMHRFSQLSRRERIQMRNQVERLSDLLSWGTLAKYYFDARDKAIYNCYGDNAKKGEKPPKEGSSLRQSQSSLHKN